jgi:TetR/AcrR family transcriptional regulator, ethionamide resistance regulator
MATAETRRDTRRRRKQEPRKGDLRETAILDAAEALLDREGVDSVTVEQIAKGAGLTRGALYFYFGSREEVVTALVARTMAVIVRDAHLAADETEVDPLETINRASVRTEKQWAEHGVVMRAAVDYTPFIPEVSKLWRGTVETYIDSMTKVLVRAGIPDRKGPKGAKRLASALCWATERNFYIAATGDGDLKSARQATVELWKRAVAGA